jgi:hypothetical protein
MAHNSIDQLYQTLRGQQLTIPDLEPIYSGWESGISPYYEELVPVINVHLDQYVTDEDARKKFKAIDLAFFASV